MNLIRAILCGALVWLCVFISFALLSFTPTVKDSLNLQAILTGILLIPFAAFGASLYYKNNNKGNGVRIALIMVSTALILDAIITVPLIEIPKGRSYASFFSYPFLWVLVLVNLATVYFYWRLKIRKGKPGLHITSTSSRF